MGFRTHLIRAMRKRGFSVSNNATLKSALQTATQPQTKVAEEPKQYADPYSQTSILGGDYGSTNEQANPKNKRRLIGGGSILGGGSLLGG